jgi:phospholipid/cholesterol/gamma-HCH transport system substrate-binding protein
MNIIKQLTSKEVKIAIVTIAALFIIVFGINYLKGINIFNPSFYYFVKFNNVDGLAKSSPVFADGFKIGIVHDIIYDYDNPGNVNVEIELDNKEMRIPKNSTAIITSNLMGTIRMNLIIPHNDTNYCAIGDTITGHIDPGLMSTVAQLVPTIEKMLPKLDSILTSVNALTSDPALSSSLHSIQTTTSNLADASAGLKRLMNKDIPGLTHKLNIVGDNAIKVTDNAVKITDNLKDINFKASMASIDSTLHNVKSITNKLNSKDNTLGLFLNDRAVYDNLSSTFINASNLLQDLKSNPKRYVHFSLFGRKSNK